MTKDEAIKLGFNYRDDDVDVLIVGEGVRSPRREDNKNINSLTKPKE